MPSRTQPLAVHPEALKPGEFVGQYEILEMLDDSGGMGCIYKVRRGKGLYAIKILKEYFLDDDSNSAKQQEDRVRADREFFCLRSVDHPNVLRAYGFDRWPEPTRGWPYIVTEYVCQFAKGLDPAVAEVFPPWLHIGVTFPIWPSSPSSVQPSAQA